METCKEIEVTHEMIEAGTLAYLGFNRIWIQLGRWWKGCIGQMAEARPVDLTAAKRQPGSNRDRENIGVVSRLDFKELEGKDTSLFRSARWSFIVNLITWPPDWSQWSWTKRFRCGRRSLSTSLMIARSS